MRMSTPLLKRAEKCAISEVKITLKIMINVPRIIAECELHYCQLNLWRYKYLIKFSPFRTFK